MYKKIRNFISNRHSYLASGLNDCYDLDGPYEVNFAVAPPEAGNISVNSLNIEEPYWGGLYFGGINTQLKAIHASPDFTFSHWEAYNHEFSPSDTMHQVSVNLIQGDYITAVFEPVLFSDSLVINEINYNADANFDCEDWVEFLQST